MNDDKHDDDPSFGEDGDDDLLNTIRRMVVEENANPPAPRPEAFPGAAPATGNAGRLVLGAAARVDEGRPARGVSSAAAPMYDETALRPVVADMVREELAELMGETLDHRIRKLVRRELASLLAAEDEMQRGD